MRNRHTFTLRIREGMVFLDIDQAPLLVPNVRKVLSSTSRTRWYAELNLLRYYYGLSLEALGPLYCICEGSSDSQVNPGVVFHLGLLIPSELVAPQRQATMPSTSNAMSRKYRVPMFFSSFVYYVLKFKHHSYSESSGKGQTIALGLFRQFCPAI